MKTKTFIVLLFSLIIYNRSFPGWIEQFSGTTNNIYSISGINDQNLYAYGSNNTLLKTTNGGINWIILNLNFPYQNMRCYFIDLNTGWVSGRNIYKTTNGGVNWVTQVINDSSYSINWFCFINQYTGWATYSRNSWPPSGGIYITTNGGINWQVQKSSADYYQCVQFINNQTGFIAGYASVYKTTNAGVVWSSNSGANGVRLSFSSADTGWITSSSVKKTTDGGLNWVYQQSGSTGQYSGIKALTGLLGFAICNSDIIKTTNGGVNWEKIYTNSSCLFNDMYFYDTLVGWVVSNGGKIFKTLNGGITGIVNQESSLTKSILLYQNYPNPFNSETKIKFDIINYHFNNRTKTTLVVFNVKGETVKTLINSLFKEGTYELTFDASALPSGVYFYQLKTENFSETKKLMLLK